MVQPGPDNIIIIVLATASIAVLKAIFEEQLIYLITMATTYLVRPFDLDGVTSTPDWCLIRDDASGAWEYCSLTYAFNLLSHKCGVFIQRYDQGTFEKLSSQRVSFGAWRKCQKARINPDNIPHPMRQIIQRLSSYQKQ
jgi:hypothetical protein